MSKKILNLSSAKLTAISIGLLLAVFCTIGMSFRPVYDEDEAAEIVMHGPRRSHWTSGSCTTTYNNNIDYAKTISQTLGNGYTTITANTKGATPVNSTDTTSGSQSYVAWNSGLSESGEKSNEELVAAHTNTITFSATPADGYYFVGWYSDAAGTSFLSDLNPWETDVAFASATGITSYGSSQDKTYESSSSPWTKTYYAKFAIIPAINVTFIAPSTSSVNRGSYTVSSQGTTTTISTSNQTIAVKGTTLTASLTDKYDFVSWYTLSGSGVKTTISTDNPCTTSFTEAISVGVDYKELTKNHLVYTYKAVEEDDKGNRKGSYTVDGVTVSENDYRYNTGDAYHYSPTLTATPASGYAFRGWYTLDGKKKNYLSTAATWNPTFTEEGETIYAGFVFNNYSDDQKAQFKVGSTYYTDLNAANTAAGSNGTIICTRDGILPPGNYTISSGVKLYIPWSTSETSQTAPAKTKYDKTANVPALSCYRKLIMVEGANITCNGTICVGGQIAELGGGYFSGYPFGACGVLDMSNGGHIELNSGAILYAWGFIKGQDMDQGNNTLDVGTITANAGAKVYEDFSGENRGGSACSALASDGISLRSFPFQGYTIQNVEVPVTYKFGSTLQVYTALYIQGDITKDFPLISNSKSLFLLKDNRSTVTKWYDPTTDLECYQLSGTAQLDAISTTIYVSINSADFNLPISSNMHIILDDCNMTLSNPIQILPDAIIEIKANATVNLTSNLFLYDVDDWKKGVASGYFAKFNNLTVHKDRGDISSKDMLSDAKLIVDGTLNVNSAGAIYTTSGGADIMGNDGGKIIFPGSLGATNKKIYQCWGAMGGTQTYDGVACSNTYSSLTGTKTYVHSVDVNTANLHNENDSYTQSKTSTTFHNVHGRWFAEADKDPKENHTHKFTYIVSGAVSGSGGTSDWTPAVYSWDKTGLELRQKWVNVTQYTCSFDSSDKNWWNGQGEQSTWFYNYTLNSAWHQFIPTEMENVYSGSDNQLYEKSTSTCGWESVGDVDENCLYTIGTVKKALVDGHFLELEANTNDPAYHLASDATQYYICFSGCNWHAATKYTGENKAYVVDDEIFIWFEGAWMNVMREEPFFYTLDETNVKVLYEYINGEWVVASPFVRVTDAVSPARNLYSFKEAVAVASAKKSATITLLRDFSEIVTPFSYTGASTTCTLDLNGHKATVTVVGAGTSEIKMFTINGASSTFTITDNSDGAKGELKLVASVNTTTSTKRWSGIYVANGSLVMQKGKLSVDHPFTWASNSNSGFISGILVASGKTFTMNGGTVYVEADYNPYGVNAASGTPTVTINGGTVETVARTKDSPYCLFGYGTINVKGGEIRSIALKSSSAMGVYIYCSSSSQGTLNVTGGTIYAEATSSARGVQCLGTAVVTGDYNATTPDNTPKTRYYANAIISGGTITAVCRTSTTSYGVLSYGTTIISGGTITSTVQTSSQNTAYGVCVLGGTTTIKNGANITANAPTKAYGVCSSAANGDGNRGWPHVGELKVEGGTITANTTNTTIAYGLYVTGTTYTINKTNSYSVFNGDYAAAGTATVTGGTFNVNAKTTTATGIVVDDTKTKNEASATPVCTINGGYFKMTGTGTLNGTNTAAQATNFHINGGYYSHNGNLAGYVTSPKQVVTLPETDTNYDPYFYEVAEAYTITFKNGDTQLQSGYQKVGTTPVYSGATPTKESTASSSYEFDGWSTTDGESIVSPLPAVTSAGATYYAHYKTTDLRYKVTLDATTNGGTCATDLVYVNPGAAVGTLPTATKTGYTFQGWYSVSAATGGTKLEATTTINADATYYARFTVNSYALTWNLDGGTVKTAGKYGSTSWPAANATGTQSTNVPYNSTLTAPVVTRTGYTFKIWSPTVAAMMPDEAVTYTAQWTPNTNTVYTVKHYQQNVDGTYPSTPTETESLKGTTTTSVTPAVKSYDGFDSPEAQTVTIGADGKTVVTYNYPRRHYTFTLDAYTNGGMSDETSIEVIHGATIGTVPPDAQKGCNDFIGWYTKAVGGVKITSDFVIEYDMKTLYAQFSDETRTWPITYLPGANGSGTVTAGTKTCGEDAVLTSSTFTRDGYEQTGWSTEDGGTKAYELGGAYTANAAVTLYPFWTLVGYQINFVAEDGTTSLGDYPKVLAPGASVTAPEAPAKATTAEYTYTFAGWSDGVNIYASDAIPVVSAAVTYRATYNAVANVASVTVNGATTYYTTLPLAFAAANSAEGASTVKMLKDVSGISASLVYSGTQNCTLDLNNHTIAGTVTKLINVNASGKTFTIDDSSAEKEGLISMIGTGNARRSALYITAGTVHLKHGKIYGKNTTTYNSSSAAKVSAAGVEIASGGKFTMDDGAVESESQYLSYALFINKSTSSDVTINGGLIKGHTNKGTTACGIYNSSTKLTINNGDIVGHAWTSTSYGLYNVYGKATINGGSIEATNDTINGKGTTTAYGICTAYNSTTYTGAITIPSTSTVKVYARTNTTTAYAVVIGGASTGSTIAGGTFTAKAGTTTAQGINSAGNITVSGGTFNVHAASTTSTITTWPCGIYTTRGTVTVSGNPTFNVTSGAARAYGVFAYGTVGKNGKTKYSGTININGGTFNVTTTTTTAYGAYAGLFSRTVNLVLSENATDTIAGTHRMPGIIEITDGTFNVTATANTAYGIVVAAQNSETIGDVTTDRIPTVTVTGGKFNITGSSKTYAVNTSATNTALDVKGGWYNINTNLAQYTAPTKSCNYWVLPLTDEDPYEYEVAEAYTITFNNYDGTPLQSSAVKKGATPAYSGATPTKAEDASYTYEFSGWSPSITAVSAAATYTAQFSSTPRTYTVTLNPNGGTINAGNVAEYTYGTGATLPTNVTKDGHEFGGWFDNSELTGDAVTSISNTATGNKEYWAKWTASIVDRELDIVDWTGNSITINVTNLKAVGGTNKNNWKIYVNDKVYTRTSPECSTQSRTLTIPGLTLTPNKNLLIQLKNDADVIESQHNYKIPQIYTANATLSGTTEESVVYVYGGKLTISGNTTLAALYVCPGAEVEVNGALTVGKLVLRTKPWATAAISGNVTATNVYYTRIAPDGSVAYPTGQYYQFGLPYECDINDVRLSDGTTPAYNTTWILKSYNEQRRAESGMENNNWDALADNATIEAGRGYEMFSSYKYYREYYFPVTPTDNTSVAVTRHGDDKNNSGWNIVCSPLMSVYENKSNPVDGLKVSWLLADGSYDQEWPETIWPALPFSYQASATGYLDFSTNELNQAVSAPRRAAYKENIQTEWLHLDVKDGNGVGDHTSVFVHPDRFEATYQTGIDVAKQSFTASRALIYSSHAYGEMAFAGVADALLEQGVALTVYSPKEQELTISMRYNEWLDRMAYVWLIDNETGAQIDLLDSDYTFEATAGTTTGRFILMGRFFAPQIATDVEQTEGEQAKPKKLIIRDKLYILINDQMYDATGKQVNSK